MWSVLLAHALAGDTWYTPGPGLRYLYRTTSTPNQIHALYVDLCEPGIAVRATTSGERGQSVPSFGSDVGAVAAINGDFFSYADYSTSGIAFGAGSAWSDTGDDTGTATVAFGEGRGMILSEGTLVSASAYPWIEDAVSGHPGLLENGADTSAVWDERHPRTAAGISEDGESIWAIELENVPDPDHPKEDWESFTLERLDRATGETNWAWSAYDDGVAGGWLEAGRAADREPYHPNALWDEGDRIFVSLHNENAILAIDTTTRDVVWRLGEDGDFTLLDVNGEPSDDWFYGQHDVKVIGDHVILYDNGLFGRETTRALVLTIDETARTAQIETSWWGDGWYTPVWGGVDPRDDGTYDVTIGVVWWINPGVDDRSALSWIEPDGAGSAEELWRIEFPDRENGIYRSDHIGGCDAFDLVAYCPELQ